MPNLDDHQLDRLLAADQLADPPAALDRAVLDRLTAAARPSESERSSWLARLAQVREEFRTLLTQPQFAGLALATRGGGEAGSVTSDEDAALGHAVQGRNIRGQIFLTALESPAGLEVMLRPQDGVEILERTVADEIGRFRFLGLDLGEYVMDVPQLGLQQSVEIRH